LKTKQANARRDGKKNIQIGVASNNQPPKCAGETGPADLPRFLFKSTGQLNGSVDKNRCSGVQSTMPVGLPDMWGGAGDVVDLDVSKICNGASLEPPRVPDRICNGV
jgi:hypothetical protein